MTFHGVGYGTSPSTTIWITDVCPWCSSGGLISIHMGPCPRIKTIEYYEDGAVKRVGFHPATGGACPT